MQDRVARLRADGDDVDRLRGWVSSVRRDPDAPWIDPGDVTDWVSRVLPPGPWIDPETTRGWLDGVRRRP